MGHDDVRVETFTTDGLPPEQRVELWEEHNASALIGLRCRTLHGGGLAATELNTRAGRIELARVLANSHVVERTQRMISVGPVDAVAAYLTLAGEAFFYHDDGVVTVRPGQMILCDVDRPFMRGFSQGLEELVVKVPRHLFRTVSSAGPDQPLQVVDFARGDLNAHTLAHLVGRAARQRRRVPVDEATVLALVGAVANGQVGDSAQIHLTVAKAFIGSHLRDSGLSATRVAAGIGISERHLSRIFAADGTSLPTYVRTQRLELAWRLLAEPAVEGTESSIAEVAAQCGFSSPTYFSSAFRTHFGQRGTDVRRAARIRHNSA